jgi:DNA primase
MSIVDKAIKYDRHSQKLKRRKKIRAIVRNVSVYQVAVELGLRPKDAGKNIETLCPFHKDNDPSFYICSEGKRKGLWQCFGCGSKGDLISLVMEINEVEFLEALEWLRSRSHNGNGSLTRLVKEIIDEYESGSHAIELPVEREVTNGEVGAIYEWMMRRRTRKGNVVFSWEDLPFLVDLFELRMGVDEYSGRVIVPVKNLDGSLCGFEALAIDRSNGVPKTLYMEGSNWVSKSVLAPLPQKLGKSLLWTIVEGCTDALRCAALGFAPISVGGSKLHSQQAALVCEFVGNGGVTVVSDADESGEKLVKSCVSELGSLMEVKVARLPEGTDPADAEWYEVIGAIKEAK